MSLGWKYITTCKYLHRFTEANRQLNSPCELGEASSKVDYHASGLIGENLPLVTWSRAGSCASAHFPAGWISHVVTYNIYSDHPSSLPHFKVHVKPNNLSNLLDPQHTYSSMPAPVQVTKASELHTNTGQTDGMIRQGAIIDQSDNLSVSGPSPLPIPQNVTLGSDLQS